MEGLLSNSDSTVVGISSCSRTPGEGMIHIEKPAPFTFSIAEHDVGPCRIFPPSDSPVKHPSSKCDWASQACAGFSRPFET